MKSAGSWSRLGGPMVLATWAVALGWAALSVGSFLALPAPLNGVVGVGAALGAAATAWLAVRLGVRYDAARIVLPGRGVTHWSDVLHIELDGRAIVVPVVGLRSGRGIEEVPLDGLAWFAPSGVPRRLAQQLAEAGGLMEVTQRQRGPRRGRRALR